MSVPTRPFGASPSSRRFIHARRRGSTQTPSLFSSEAAFSASSSSAIGGSQVATPTFGRAEFGNSSSGGQRRGSRVAPFTPTEEETGQWPGKLQSICGMTMPVYKCKSHEELRWEDYQLGDKGGPNHAGQSGVSVGPGASPAIPRPNFSQSSPFSSTTASNTVSSAPASATASNPSASTPSGSSPFGFTLAQASTSGTTSHPSLPAFGSSIFRSSMPWGAQSQSVFRASSNPGSSSTAPAFGTTSPSFEATSTPAFAAFGSTGSPLSGSGSAFGASSNAAFGVSFGSSLSFGSSPAFGPSETAFRSNQFDSEFYGAHRGSRVAPFTPTEDREEIGQMRHQKLQSICGMPFYQSKSHEELRWEDCQLEEKGGSRVAPFTPTEDREETGQMRHQKLQSICGMPFYQSKSHEELRWEDYQLGDKGGPNHVGQSGVSVGPGASPAVPLPTFSRSSLSISTTATNAISSAPASSGSGRSLLPSRPSPVLSTNADAISQTNECAVCLKNPKNMAFGCGHMACGECERRLSRCPMCRQPITIRLRLYM